MEAYIKRDSKTDSTLTSKKKEESHERLLQRLAGTHLGEKTLEAIQLEEMILKGPKNYLIINGLSAWTVGQLDGEIEMERWTLSESDINLIFDAEDKKKWQKAIKSSFIRL